MCTVAPSPCTVHQNILLSHTVGATPCRDEATPHAVGATLHGDGVIPHSNGAISHGDGVLSVGRIMFPVFTMAFARKASHGLVATH